jgi:prolyl-tRNA editing enzyme YbaK/EbsC (Cys-tRNA(Pro) deacylase)
MSLESVRAWLANHAPDLSLIHNGGSVATVAEAAATLKVPPALIAKTLAVRFDDRIVLIVTRGDARLDNGKCNQAFGTRPRMLGPEDTEVLTGHPIGGISPFALAKPLQVYCDVSLKEFSKVYPAAGTRTHSVEISPDRLFKIVAGVWVDVCRLSQQQL